MDNAYGLCTNCGRPHATTEITATNLTAESTGQVRPKDPACRCPSTPIADPNIPRLFTTDQIAERLAVSKRTVYTLIQRGELRSVTVGRARRIPAKSLDEFIDNLGRAAV